MSACLTVSDIIISRGSGKIVGGGEPIKTCSGPAVGHSPLGVLQTTGHGMPTSRHHSKSNGADIHTHTSLFLPSSTPNKTVSWLHPFREPNVGVLVRDISFLGGLDMQCLPQTCNTRGVGRPLRHKVKIIPHRTHPNPKPRPPTPNKSLPTTRPIIEIRLLQNPRELQGANSEASIEWDSNDPGE